MFIFAFFAILAVSGFSYGKNAFSNFVSIKPATKDIQQQTTLDFRLTVNAPNKASAQSIAQYYAIHQAVSLLEERDIPFEQLPDAITADLSKFVTKTDIQQAENITGKYKATITVDIQKIKQHIPEYWHRTTIQNKDINALFVRRNALNDIMQEIDKIFADYPAQVYSGVRKGMFEVVHAPMGSGREARIEHLPIYGKTGSAEIGSRQNRSHITWFICYFTHAERTYAMAVMVEDGRSGGKTCAPIARRFITQWLPKPQKTAAD